MHQWDQSGAGATPVDLLDAEINKMMLEGQINFQNSARDFCDFEIT